MCGLGAWLFIKLVIDGNKSAKMADSGLLVQLLDMGFEIDQIEACQLALASSNSPLTLQAATER